MDALLGSLMVIGAGVLLAGLAGLMLPADHRARAAFALVIGAGTGVAATAVGWSIVEGMTAESTQAYERAFLVASIIGFVATLAALGVAWRRAREAPESPVTKGARGRSSYG